MKFRWNCHLFNIYLGARTNVEQWMVWHQFELGLTQRQIKGKRALILPFLLPFVRQTKAEIALVRDVRHSNARWLDSRMAESRSRIPSIYIALWCLPGSWKDAGCGWKGECRVGRWSSWSRTMLCCDAGHISAIAKGVIFVALMDMPCTFWGGFPRSVVLPFGRFIGCWGLRWCFKKPMRRIRSNINARPLQILPPKTALRLLTRSLGTGDGEGEGAAKVRMAVRRITVKVAVARLLALILM